jgi:excisionase family DNA binding protein
MEKMLTPQDVANHYGVSVESVWRWIREGRLPAMSLTKRSYRIRTADLEAFEHERRYTGASAK